MQSIDRVTTLQQTPNPRIAAAADAAVEVIALVPADNGMRAAMVKLSRALGHPPEVLAREGQSVDAALIELAAQRLAGGVTGAPESKEKNHG